MHLIVAILGSTILGYLLLMMGPLVGGLLAFGIVTGTLFRVLYLLNDVYKKLSSGFSKSDKSKEVLKNHLKESLIKEQG